MRFGQWIQWIYSKYILLGVATSTLKDVSSFFYGPLLRIIFIRDSVVNYSVSLSILRVFWSSEDYSYFFFIL